MPERKDGTDKSPGNATRSQTQAELIAVEDKDLGATSGSFGSLGLRQALSANISLVTGDTTLSSKQQAVLRTRLKAAALVVLFGFGIYLIRSYFDSRPLQGFHTLVVVLEMAAIGLLISSYEITTKQLRWLELMIFGFPVLFFVPYQYYCVLQEAEKSDPVSLVAIYKNVSSYWFCLLVIYGLFVPNRWQRSLILVSPMVVLPFVVGVAARFSDELVAQHLTYLQITDTFMILLVGAFCASYGAEVIHALRLEAHEAKRLGQYQLGDRIGKGGMGEVFKAEHQLLKRPCAVKLIRPDQVHNDDMLKRFEREVQTAASLTHWNTIEIYDYGHTEDGTFYYVMEYLPGMSLAQMLKRNGPLPERRVIHLLRQVCGALAEAHSKAFIHRDITAGNIYVTQRGGNYDVAKLLDFGLVKLATGNISGEQITEYGSINGTPKFMSPEQASTEVEPDARSDLYSLGVVAFMALTGKVPFDGPSSMKILIAHARDPVPGVRALNSAISTEMERVVLKCLEKEPHDRYQSALELDADLAKLEKEDGWTQNEASSWWRDNGFAKKRRKTPLTARPSVPTRDAQAATQADVVRKS